MGIIRRVLIFSGTLMHDTLAKQIAFAVLVLGVCLLIGIFGYHYIAQIGWIDSLHNASMILKEEECDFDNPEEVASLREAYQKDYDEYVVLAEKLMKDNIGGWVYEW